MNQNDLPGRPDLNFDKMTEADVRANFIKPAILKSNWSEDQFKHEFYFTDGRMHIDGERDEGTEAPAALRPL